MRRTSNLGAISVFKAKASLCLIEGLRAAVLILIVLFGFVAPASKARASANSPLVIQDDFGGFLLARLAELKELRDSGRRVEIRGEVCYSTCTLFLSLPNTCISPDTQFGFHGPSKSGRRLSPGNFDHYSRVIAGHYPKRLSNWYMRKGRNRIDGVYKMSGARIIRMGIQSC